VQEFQVHRVLELALRMKAQTTPIAEVGKILFVENLVGEKKRERLNNWGMQGTLKTVILWVIGDWVL
jgi:hypothetical protein